MKYLLLGSSMLLLISCNGVSPNVINIADEYPLKVSLEKSSSAPSSKILGKSGMRVVVINIDDHFNQTSKESNLGKSMASELASQLVETKSVEVLKRLEEPVFLKELQKHELAKKYGTSLENADYLLTGEVTDATFINRFHPQRTRTEGGVTPSWGAYRACIRGTINLFKLPSLQIQEVFPFKECSQEREPISRPKNMKQKNPALIIKNIPDALEDIVSNMKKYFKPKGYVYAMRSSANGKKKILKTTLNRGFGAVEGRQIEIIRVEKEINPLNGKEDFTEFIIGYGTVSNVITDEYSFITIDSLKSQVRIGDVVKVRR